MTENLKRQRVKSGDVLRVDLGDGRQTYALVSASPLVVFFDHIVSSERLPERILEMPVAFKVWVMNSALGSGRWPRTGWVHLPPEWLEQPLFFKQDAISGRLALRHDRFADTNYERPATLSECRGLERAAVWNAEHVEDRLRDHFAGQPNKWVESMQIDVYRVPDEQRR